MSCAVQLQKAEEGAPEVVEFDRVKDHLEPYIRRSQAQALQQQQLRPVASSSTPSTSAAGAATAASASLFKDIPGFNTRYPSMFGLAARARGGGTGPGADQGTARDELEPYSSAYPARGGGGGGGTRDVKGKGVRRESDRVAAMRDMTDLDDVASFDQRSTLSWNPPLLSRYDPALQLGSLPLGCPPSPATCH